MYRKESRIVGNTTELGNYIQGADVYNSKVLYDLMSSEIEKDSYEIKTFEYRPDLIALDYYGSVDYLPYVLISSGIGLEQFTKGTIIKLIPKHYIQGIINSI